MALIGALAFGLFSFTTSPRYYIRHLHIDGLYTVNSQRVIVAADIRPETNIFLYEIRERKALCARVQASDPAIQSASTAIQLPNTLVIHVQERQPYAVLHLQNGPSYEMDASACAYRQIAPNQSDLPIVTVPASSSSIIKGTPLPSDMGDHVSAAFNLMNMIQDRQIGPLSGFREVIVDPFDNVNLRLDNGLIIKFGQEDGMPQRLADLETALTAQPSLVSVAQYLDFTTSRYAIMKKPAPLTVLTGNEQPIGPSSPLSAAIGQ